jgi:hypothetical protein
MSISTSGAWTPSRSLVSSTVLWGARTSQAAGDRERARDRWRASSRLRREVDREVGAGVQNALELYVQLVACLQYSGGDQYQRPVRGAMAREGVDPPAKCALTPVQAGETRRRIFRSYVARARRNGPTAMPNGFRSIPMSPAERLDEVARLRLRPERAEGMGAPAGLVEHQGLPTTV